MTTSPIGVSPVPTPLFQGYSCAMCNSYVMPGTIHQCLASCGSSGTGVYRSVSGALQASKCARCYALVEPSDQQMHTAEHIKMDRIWEAVRQLAVSTYQVQDTHEKAFLTVGERLADLEGDEVTVLDTDPNEEFDN